MATLSTEALRSGQTAQTAGEFERLLSRQSAIRPGYDDSDGYELLKKMALAFSKSSLVPEAYREKIVKKATSANDWKETVIDNPQGLPNCMVALNMALRMGADPLMVMQNLYVVEGRPSWSAQYVIAAINACGRYSPLRFDMSEEEPMRTIEYQVTEGYGEKRKVITKAVNVRNRTCRAWVIEKNTGERLQGSVVSIEMAISEGWYTKNGSKWKTIPEQMLMYRAAAFFGRIYAPDLLMGIPLRDELNDMLNEDVAATEMSVGAAKIIESLRSAEAAHAEQTASEMNQSSQQEEPAPNSEGDTPAPAEPKQPALETPIDPYDDWRLAFADCQTADDCGAVMASCKYSPKSEEFAAIRKICEERKQAIAEAQK